MGFMKELDIMMHQSKVEEQEAKNEVLERDFERNPEPVSEPAVVATFVMPPISYTKEGRRHQLVFEGVCTHCAHCGQPLSDAVSIERGIGPVCSKKGYAEDPKNADEMQAMIDLAEFPALMNFVVERYKPQGVRAMMNALVKICSLNRRSPVHPACCDAIESLGYTRLASTLRESLAVVEISDAPGSPGHYRIWIKKSAWHWQWTSAMRAIPGSYFSKQYKGTIVPKVHKRQIWDNMLKYYDGLCAKTPNGVVKIMAKNVATRQVTPDVTPLLAAG
jgi:hypothetical protein